MLRTRSKVYKEREEIVQAIKGMALNHEILANELSPSYVSSLCNITASMKIEDPEICFSLVAYISQHAHLFDLRSLATIVNSLTKISKLKPVILNFDDFYRKIEIVLVK